MKARLVKFGEIEVEGKRYTHDVVIDGGKVRKRKKGPSKEFREQFGHTPLSVGEEIPFRFSFLLSNFMSVIFFSASGWLQRLVRPFEEKSAHHPHLEHRTRVDLLGALYRSAVETPGVVPPAHLRR